MQRDELWHIYVKKNPQFAVEAAHITLTGKGLRKLFEQTWDQAHDQGLKNGRALAERDQPQSIFESVFGRKA